MSCALTSIVTEVCSNAATANILLPGDPALAGSTPPSVLGELAVTLELNPLYLMLPATITCCYAFMLPVSCPPNAIVYKASGGPWCPLPWCPGMKSWQMVMAGAGLNLVALGVSRLSGATLVLDMWWARSPCHGAANTGLFRTVEPNSPRTVYGLPLYRFDS